MTSTGADIFDGSKLWDQINFADETHHFTTNGKMVTFATAAHEHPRPIDQVKCEHPAAVPTGVIEELNDEIEAAEALYVQAVTLFIAAVGFGVAFDVLTWGAALTLTGSSFAAFSYVVACNANVLAAKAKLQNTLCGYH